ncbi:MAG TPA: ATP-binding protein [Vicinamibacterales bacterium]|nr:ATP-binding protein [Vicinamibacterales bacterium]
MAPSEPFPDGHGTTVTVACDGDIVTARQHGRAFVQQLGFSVLEAMLIATAISELARNIVLHAQRGEILICRVEQNGRLGVLVIARDEGPGIADVQEATADRHSIRLGLRGLKRLVDELEIASILGRGTTVSVKKWKG